MRKTHRTHVAGPKSGGMELLSSSRSGFAFLGFHRETWTTVCLLWKTLFPFRAVIRNPGLSCERIYARPFAGTLDVASGRTIAAHTGDGTKIRKRQFAGFFHN